MEQRGALVIKKKSDLHYSDEMIFAKAQTEGITNAHLREEVEHRLLWFIGKAQRNRIAYYTLSIVSMVSGAVIPVLNGLGRKGTPSLVDVLVSVLAALGGLATGICTLFNCQETWNRNRKFAEQLKKDCLQCRLAEHELSEAEKDLAASFLELTKDELGEWLKQKHSGPASKG